LALTSPSFHWRDYLFSKFGIIHYPNRSEEKEEHNNPHFGTAGVHVCWRGLLKFEVQIMTFMASLEHSMLLSEAFPGAAKSPE
jgi:hypothetical protein